MHMNRLPFAEAHRLVTHPVACIDCHDAATMQLRVARAQELQRRAQFFLDFVEAENSMGFHAPQEAARILGESINFSRQGQVAMRDRTRQ
jgi:formate-dependent nitrite reductase cytochrome c552 subunit